MPTLLLVVHSPHMRKLYGDSLRKDAGFVKVIKSVASKNARLLESRAERHAPELKRVAKEVKGTFDKVYEETAEVVEEFLAKCELSGPGGGWLVLRLICYSSPEDLGGCAGYEGAASAVPRTTYYYVSNLVYGFVFSY